MDYFAFALQNARDEFEREPLRTIRLIVLNSGKIRVMFGANVGLTYESWRHWFATGIGAYADRDLVFVHCVRGTAWIND